MPDLKELLKERNVKKFTKKSYRPWDLSGEPSSTTEENTIGHISSQNTDKGTIIDIDSQDGIADHLPAEKSNKDNNKISNSYHSDSSIDINGVSNRYQLDNTIDGNKESNRYPIDINSDSNKIPSLSRKSEQKSALSLQNPSHKNENISELKIEPVIDGSSMALEQGIISLSGKQKVIFDVIVDICLARNSTTTGPVQTASLAIVAQTTTGTIKTMLMRLIQKQLLVRYPGKNAKGGYVNLGVTSTVLALVENIKSSKKHNLFASDVVISNRYQKDISQEYISNSNNYINTTNLNKKNEQIPSEWENINFDPLEHIGFSKTQIKQLIGKSEPTIVQESINHFAYGLENNQKIMKYEEPLNVLMGVLRKGLAWVEGDYRSSIEIAQEKLLAAKKAEMNRKKALEEEAYTLAFTEWESTLPEQEKLKLTEKKKGDLTPPKAQLSIYFKENVWPLIKSEYVLF